jgi:hypothetical protein
MKLKTIDELHLMDKENLVQWCRHVQCIVAQINKLIDTASDRYIPAKQHPVYVGLEGGPVGVSGPTEEEW